MKYDRRELLESSSNETLNKKWEDRKYEAEDSSEGLMIVYVSLAFIFVMWFVKTF